MTDVDGDGPGETAAVERQGESLTSYVVPNAGRVASAVLGALAALSAVPALVQYTDWFNLSETEQVLASLSLLLTYVSALLILVVKDVYADLNALEAEVEDEIRRRKRMMRDQIFELNDTFFGLAFSILLYEPPDAVDARHYISLCHSEVDIVDGRVTFEEQFKGYNASNEPTDHLPILITGESRLQPTELDLKMWHERDGEFVTQDNWEAESLGKYEVLVKLTFPDELQPDDKFNIKYRSEAGEWPMDEDQYVFLPQHRFARGTERFIAEFVVDSAHNVEFDARKIVPETLSHFRSPQRVNFEMNELDDEITNSVVGSGRTEITVVDDNTKGLYLFRFDA